MANSGVIPKLMTRDQRSALRDQGAFAIKTLKKLQRMCGRDMPSNRVMVNDIWRTLNFAVFDLNLAKARRQLNAHKKKRKPPLCY